MTKKVFLSPSLQTNNIGVNAYGSEAFRMNQVADVVEARLKKSKVAVYRNEISWNLAKTVSYANSIDSINAYVAIHSNAGGNGQVKGAEIWAYGKGTNSYKLAENIYKKLTPLTSWAARGIKNANSKSLYEVVKTKATACLIEVDFHDNPISANFIINNIQAIGESIADGILIYLGVPLANENNGKEGAGASKIKLPSGDIVVIDSYLIEKSTWVPIRRLCQLLGYNVKYENGIIELS